MTTENIDSRPTEAPPEAPVTGWDSWSMKRKGWTLAGAAVAFLLLISMCSGNGDTKKKDEPPAASTSTSVSAPAPETANTEPAEPEVPKPPHDATATVNENGSVDIAFDIGDNFTHNMIVRKAQGDTVDLLKWAKENYPAASEVVITGRFPMTDQFGNTATDEILIVAYTRATLDKINFGGVNRENIWTLADRRYVHPELRVN